MTTPAIEYSWEPPVDRAIVDAFPIAEQDVPEEGTE